MITKLHNSHQVFFAFVTDRSPKRHAVCSGRTIGAELSDIFVAETPFDFLQDMFVSDHTPWPTVSDFHVISLSVARCNDIVVFSEVGFVAESGGDEAGGEFGDVVEEEEADEDCYSGGGGCVGVWIGDAEKRGGGCCGEF